MSADPRREADGVLHGLWTWAVGKEGYDKQEWKRLEALIWKSGRSGNAKPPEPLRRRLLALEEMSLQAAMGRRVWDSNCRREQTATIGELLEWGVAANTVRNSEG